MPQNWTGKWAGGRTWVDRRGHTRWTLERMVAGARFDRRLEVNSEKDALAELALFDRDPAAYVTPKEQADEEAARALVVNADTIAQVRDHLEQGERNPKYIAGVVAYLATWGEDLAGRDLKRVKIEDLKVILAKHKTARPKRINAIKTFTSYFRTEVNTLAAADDPTLSLLTIQSKPEKLQREKGYSIESIEAVYAAIFDWERERSKPDSWGRTRTRGSTTVGRRQAWGDLQGVRDLLVLRSKYGMHGSEVDRLTSGKAVIKVVKGHGLIAATVRFPHKNGDDHVISVDLQGLAAAQRLQIHGAPISDSFVRYTLRHAARKAGLEAFNPGELRHSFITIAREAGTLVKPALGGVGISEIQAVVGHSTGSRMTSGTYLGAHIPPMISLPLKLQHPDDPAALPALKIVSAS